MMSKITSLLERTKLVDYLLDKQASLYTDYNINNNELEAIDSGSVKDIISLRMKKCKLLGAISVVDDILDHIVDFEFDFDIKSLPKQEAISMLQEALDYLKGDTNEEKLL